MAFEEVNSNNEQVKKYWTPSIENEKIEGPIVEFVDDDYGNRCPVLAVESDEYPSQKVKTKLPGHTVLIKKIEQFEPGDYIRVTYLGKKNPKNGGYRQYNDYKVEIDRDKFQNLDMIWG